MLRRFALNSQLLLTAVAILILLSGSQAVLCFGADGHVAIESAVFDRCCDGNQGPQTEEGSFNRRAVDDAADCGSCYDVPFSTSASALTPATVQVTNFQAVVVPPLWGSETVYFPHRLDKSGLLNDPAHFLHASQAARLRSVCLLV